MKTLTSNDLITMFREQVNKPNIHTYRPYKGTQLDFHHHTSRGRIILGGNRAGKTVAGATESVWWLLGTHPHQYTPEPPIYGRGSAVDIEQGLKKIMLPELAKWLPPSALINGAWEDSYDKQSRLLTLANGSRMDFLTYEMDPEKHAGTSRHFIWFDEEPPEFIFNEDLLRTVDVAGHWWLTMTPVLGMTWLYYKYYEPRDSLTDVVVFEAPTENNPYLPEGSLDVILAGMNEEERNARKYGQFMAASGLIYPEFHPVLHVIPPINPVGLNAVCGMDSGLRNPTAWLWATVDPEGRIIIFHEHYAAEKVVSEHAQAVLDYEQAMDIRVTYRIGDPAIKHRNVLTGSSVQTEYADYGVFIGLGNNDVTYGLNRTRQMIRQLGIKITSDCTNLIKELHNYRWDTYATRKGNDTKQAKDAPKKLKDHACDALRYLVCSRPENEYGGFVNDDVRVPTYTGPHTVPSTEPVYESDYSVDSDRFHPILGSDW